jgi:hypothetical protein
MRVSRVRLPPMQGACIMSVIFIPCSIGGAIFKDAILSHYTDSKGAPPGKKLGWMIYEGPRQIGVVGIGEPSFKLSPRRRLGLEDARPLQFTVNCFIFRVQNAQTSSSAILKAWHPMAAASWQGVYGWRPLHWETMIGGPGDGGRQHHGGALGACFRRAGYRKLGWTTGRTARRPPGNTDINGPRVWGDGPKRLVLYRGPLARVEPCR